MPITALMIVSETDCAATILGVPLVEFQMRRAVAAGAGHIVLLVERMPAALLAAADRLRRERIGVDVARGVSDAIDFVHPEDRVLFVPSNVHAGPADVAALVAATGPAVLATATEGAPPWFDIVDARRRWTGWAAFDGAELRTIGALIGDWDLAPTVLRHLLQQRARVHVASADAPVVPLDRAAGRQDLGRRLIADGQSREGGAGVRLVRDPLAAQLARLASEAGLRAAWIDGLAALLSVMAIAGALWGLIALPVLLITVAFVVAAAAACLMRALGHAPHHSNRFMLAIDGAAASVLLIASATLAQATQQWGCIVLALAAVGGLALLRSFGAVATRAAALADATSTSLLVGLGALFGVPVIALAAGVVHIAVSIGWCRAAELRVHRGLAPN